MTLEKQETEVVISVDIHQKPDARLSITCLCLIRFYLNVSLKEGERDGQRQKRRT